MWSLVLLFTPPLLTPKSPDTLTPGLLPGVIEFDES
jgi:hypothetical protein